MFIFVNNIVMVNFDDEFDSIWDHQGDTSLDVSVRNFQRALT